MSTSALGTSPSLRVIILLYLTLILAIVDLSLSLINIGLSSFFLGLIAASGTIIHILTHLCIIFIQRSKQSDTTNEITLTNSIWEFLPPTSKISSLTMDVFLAIIFVAGCSITLLSQLTGYFGWPKEGTSILRGPVSIIYADAAMEASCAIALVALAIVGSCERRQFVDSTKKNPPGGEA